VQDFNLEQMRKPALSGARCPGAKTFEILVNDKVIATENISNIKDGQFITVQYDIPEELLKGRSKITVTFKAQPGNTAGPVFGVRTILR